MKVRRRGAACGLAFGIAVSAGFWGCGRGEEADHDHGESAKGHADHEGEGHEDHKEGEAHDEEGVVRITAEAQRRSGIVVKPAPAGSLSAQMEIPAEVQLNPDRVAHISPLVDGQLLSVDVTLGDQVKAGQQLARLRSVALGQARAELSRARAMREVAAQTRKRQRRLRAEGISSERSLLEAELAYKQADAEQDAASSRLRVLGVKGGSGPDMDLSSPIDGLIVERHATRGESVSPSDTLFVVADLSRVWIIGRVYEQQIARVRPGGPATLTLNAYPGRTWPGVVDYVGATLDEATRTLPIRVELENPDGTLRPGLFGALSLAVGEAPARAAVLLPQGAVQSMGEGAVVFVPGDAPGEFEARPVTTGASGRGQVEITAGLEAGAEVVVEGAFVLKSELIRGELGHGHAH